MQRLQSLSVRFLISNLFKPQRVKVNSTAQSLQKIFTSDVWFLITVDLILTSDAHWWNKTFCPDMIAQVFSCSKGGRVSVEFKNFNETWTLRLEPGSQLLLLTSCWTKSLKKNSLMFENFSTFSVTRPQTWKRLERVSARRALPVVLSYLEDIRFRFRSSPVPYIPMLKKTNNIVLIWRGEMDKCAIIVSTIFFFFFYFGLNSFYCQACK